MHLLGAVANCRKSPSLIDHPATFPCVWSVLGWNIHVYHSHLDVHPPLRAPLRFRFEWHQDGGRQNREIETTPQAAALGETGLLAPPTSPRLGAAT